MPLRSLLHLPHEYILSPLSSSAEKNAARQSVSDTDGPHTQAQSLSPGVKDRAGEYAFTADNDS